jgi:hypothetical protein
LPGNAWYLSFVDQNDQRRFIFAARLKMHAINRLNLAALACVDVDIDFSRKLLQLGNQLPNDHWRLLFLNRAGDDYLNEREY